MGLGGVADTTRDPGRLGLAQRRRGFAVGPDPQLLADATSDSGDFKWWLAFFPGMVIFLTVLAYNLIGESFQMAIDPKLRKARV